MTEQTSISAAAPNSTMPRPTQYDPLIVRAAAEKLAVECAEWDGEAADWVEDLIKCKSYWSDGYQLARELQDRCYIDPDSELVEILDGASSYLYDAHSDAVKKWVRIVGFSPKYAVGDMVSCRHGEGPIHSIRVETAEYVIDTEGRGNGGFVIAAEDVRPATNPTPSRDEAAGVSPSPAASPSNRSMNDAE